MVFLFSHLSIYCSGLLRIFFRATTCLEVARNQQILLGMILNLDRWKGGNSRGDCTSIWSHLIKDRRKQGHWPLQITLCTYYFRGLIATFRSIQIDAIFSILTISSSNNAFRFDLNERFKYLPLVPMSKSPHDKYNFVKKYFDLVPPDELSVTGKAIQIFQHPASAKQIEVRTFLFYLLFWASTAIPFVLIALTSAFFFFFVPFYIDLAPSKTSVSCCTWQPCLWC